MAWRGLPALPAAHTPTLLHCRRPVVHSISLTHVVRCRAHEGQGQGGAPDLPSLPSISSFDCSPQGSLIPKIPKQQASKSPAPGSTASSSPAPRASPAGLDPEGDDTQTLRQEVLKRDRDSPPWRKAASPESSYQDAAEAAEERERLKAAVRLIRSPPPPDIQSTPSSSPPTDQPSTTAAAEDTRYARPGGGDEAGSSEATSSRVVGTIVGLPPGLRTDSSSSSSRARGGRVNGDGQDEEEAVSVTSTSSSSSSSAGAVQTSLDTDPTVVNRSTDWGDPEGFAEVSTCQ
jgi:hypothetical protein